MPVRRIRPPTNYKRGRKVESNPRENPRCRMLPQASVGGLKRRAWPTTAGAWTARGRLWRKDAAGGVRGVPAQFGRSAYQYRGSQVEYFHVRRT